MNFLRRQLSRSPIYARVLPFVLFVAPLFIQDMLGETLRYWVYLARILIGAWCLWEMRALIPEMRWKVSWEGFVVGVLVLVIWVGLDPYYPKNHLLFKPGDLWNPFAHFGENSAWGWFFFSVRTIGTAVVVPPLEEVFYRSFLYRFLINDKFETVPLSKLDWRSLIVMSLFFGFQHYQWLAGILCGLAFQFLVIKKRRLGDAIFAHATTNFLLGLWIYWKGAWQFW